MLSKLFLGGSDENDSDVEKQKHSKESGMMGMFGSFIQIIKDTFEEAIREIEIEVYWYYGGEEEVNKEKFTLVTHIIDFKALNKLPDINAMFRGAAKRINKSKPSRGGVKWKKPSL